MRQKIGAGVIINEIINTGISKINGVSLFVRVFDTLFILNKSGVNSISTKISLKAIDINISELLREFAKYAHIMGMNNAMPYMIKILLAFFRGIEIKIVRKNNVTNGLKVFILENITRIDSRMIKNKLKSNTKLTNKQVIFINNLRF